MSEDPVPSELPVARPYRPRNRMRWLTTLVFLTCVGAVLGFAMGLISAFLAPKYYESVTVVQIHSPTQARGPLADGLSSLPAPQDPDRFLETELEVLQAPETLIRVRDRLDLPARWGGMDPDDVVAELRPLVVVERLAGTDLARIRVHHTSAQDARDIAVEVPRAYRERRAALERKRANDALNALDQEVRAQEDLVEEKRKLFHTIVKAVGIPYIEDLPGSGLMGRNEEERLRGAGREQLKLETEKRFLEIEIKTLLRLTSDEFLKFVVQGDRAPELKRVWQKFNELRTELKIEREKLGEEDLNVRALEKSVARQEKELREAVAAYQEKLQIDLELTDYRLQKMKEITEERRFDAVDKSLQSQDYVEAKQDYAAAKALLQEMKRLHSSRRIALKMPSNPVTIHEEPVIAKVPKSANLNRILVRGFVVGSGVGLLIALPIAALMIARGP